MENRVATKRTDVFPHVVWAVDPLGSNLDLQTRAMRALESLTTTPKKVEPVYVLGQGLLDRLSGSLGMVKRERRARGRMRRLERLVSIPGLEPLKVLHQDGGSPHSSVRELCQYAVETGAELIAVSTRGLTGTARILSGSFVEDLITKSPTSVLVSNGEVPQVSHVGELVFPTDFSDESGTLFDEVVQLASRLNAKICLVHHFEHVQDPLYPVLLTPTLKRSVMIAEQQKRSLAKRWLSSARERGVHGRFILSKHFGSTSEAVLKTVNRLPASLVVMGSWRRLLPLPFLGGIARRIIRKSQRPVLILRHKPSKAPLTTLAA